jgi:hypothetical protein
MRLGACAQQYVCVRRGFCVLNTFGFFIYIYHADSAQLVGLGIPLRSIAKPSYAPPDRKHSRYWQA